MIWHKLRHSTSLWEITDGKWQAVRGGPFLRTVFLICTRCKFGLTHPPPNFHKFEKKIKQGWEIDMFQLRSLSLANRRLSCIYYFETEWIWRLKLAKIVLKQEFKEKLKFTRCTYYFSPCNLHSRYFSTHPPTLICTLCKLEKPYAKMDRP